MKRLLINPQNVDLSTLETIALNAIAANTVNDCNEAAFNAVLENLYGIYGIRYKYVSENEDTRVKAAAAADIKPLRLNELLVKTACREYAVNDNIDCDTPLNAAFHFNVDKALAACFLKSLTSPKIKRDKDGNVKKATYNHTAMLLRLNQNMCYSLEDIQQTIALALCENTEGIEYSYSYPKKDRQEAIIDGVNLSNECIKACFAAASNEMYRQATRHNKRLNNDDIIAAALNSRDLNDDNSNEAMEKTAAANVANRIDSLELLKADVYKACNRLFKAATAADVYTLFEYRLNGYKFKECAAAMGCNDDRIKYLQRQIVKIAADMGYTRVNKPYTEKPIPTHKIILSGKEYTVTSVKAVKAVKRGKMRGISGLENIKAVKAVKMVKWYSIDNNDKHYYMTKEA